jgi:hypothetical protein
MNICLTKTISSILLRDEAARDSILLTIQHVHDEELSMWGISKEGYYDAVFSSKLSSVHTIRRTWQMVQEKRPELRGKLWEQRQKQAGIFVSELLTLNTQLGLF